MQTSKDLVNDILWYFILRKSYRKSADQKRIQLARMMDGLCREFERRYVKRFPSLGDQLFLEGDVAITEVRATFYCVSDELFNDAINWGRIVAFFAFSVSLARQLKKEMSSKAAAECIRNLMIEYIKRTILPWIEDNNGWDGFLEYFQNRKPPRPRWWLWPSIGRVAGLAIGLGISAYLSQKG